VETISQQAARLQNEWDTNPRWNDTKRTYSAEDVVRLRGSITEEFTLARSAPSGCASCWPRRTP
jgi:isocitrate lyase